MALMTLVRIVDRARATAGDRTDRGARAAPCNGADGRATRCTDADSLDGSPNMMPAMIPVINHIGHHRFMC